MSSAHPLAAAISAAALLLVGLPLSACDDAVGTADADGAEVSADVPGEDTTPDATPDATADSTPDAVADAVADAKADTAEDAAPDAADTPDAGDTGDAGPPPQCPATVDCDDGLACTDDSCTLPGAVCTWTLKAGTCLVNGVCASDGDERPSNSCQVCDAASPHQWTAATQGKSCDDGNACTQSSTCEAGVCVGAAMPCADAEGCTIDTCDPKVGCSNVAVAEGEPCSDNDACTVGEICSFGECAGTPIDCDDDNPCTDDVCDEVLGCVSVDSTSACEDGDLCTTGDECTDGACVAGPPDNCDDGNACTIDLCDEDAGCVHLPTESPCCVGDTSICDDGDPCTVDLCDPGTGGCSSEPSAAKCDDGDACTTGDTCTEGACVGAVLSCDDANPCTSDGCNSLQGCFHNTIGSGPCDDGLECTTSDVCVAGQCVGDDSACVCVPVFSPDAVKANVVALGNGGKPGEALDLDNDPSTCAPAAQPCSDGINNSLGALAAFASGPLEDAVASGSLMLVVEVRELTSSTLSLSVYQADLDPSNADCDFQTTSCAYLVDSVTLDPETCAPLVVLPGTISGQKVVAGGPGSVFPFNLPFGDGAALSITLYDVRFEGTATITQGNVVTLDGIIGGAVPKAELLAAVDALPPDTLPPELPLFLVKGFIEALDTDIDADGDGTNESASLGLKIKAIDATISGVQ